MQHPGRPIGRNGPKVPFYGSQMPLKNPQGIARPTQRICQVRASQSQIEGSAPQRLALLWCDQTKGHNGFWPKVCESGLTSRSFFTTAAFDSIRLYDAPTQSPKIASPQSALEGVKRFRSWFPRSAATHTANVIAWKQVSEAFRKAVSTGHLVCGTGRTQRDCPTTHLIAERVKDVSFLLVTLGRPVAIDTSDGRAGETKRPEGGSVRPSARYPRERAKKLFPSRDCH